MQPGSQITPQQVTKGGPRVIETIFKGHRFRSRTEARWAVAFDAEGITWLYEEEGFELPGVGRYLPDFWLPQVSMWAEVKGEPFTTAELKAAAALAEASDHPVLLLQGRPDDCAYWAIEPPDREWGWPEQLDDGTTVHACDYAPFEGSQYHLCEKRFFASTGEPGVFPSPGPYAYDSWGGTTSPGVLAARSARFEFGESGATI